MGSSKLNYGSILVGVWGLLYYLFSEVCGEVRFSCTVLCVLVNGGVARTFTDVTLAVLSMFGVVIITILRIICSYNCCYTPVVRPEYM